MSLATREGGRHMNAGQRYFVVSGSKANPFSCFPVWMLAVQSISAKYAVGDRVGMQRLIDASRLVGNLFEARENVADLRRSNIVLGQELLALDDIRLPALFGTLTQSFVLSRGLSCFWRRARREAGRSKARCGSRVA